MASALHLGNPQRALLAFTQWRTSWLSREAVLAIAALATAGCYAALFVFYGMQVSVVGAVAATLCIATVVATAMIYAQLKTVPRWHHWTTPALFVGLSLGGGALLAAQTGAAIGLLVLAGALQLWAWRGGDTRFATRATTLASATGLGHIGAVRSFAPPHTGSNYLLDEMVFRVGRKHAVRLRVIGFALMIVAPVTILGLVAGGHVAGTAAILCHVAGALVTRWLFFAEAEHVVGLYYGAHGMRAP